MLTLKEILSSLFEEVNNNGPKLMLEHKNPISEGLQYHIDNNVQLIENIYRPLSKNYFALFTEARQLYNEGKLLVSAADKELLETEIGEFVDIEGKKVPLDYLFYEGEMNEEEKKVQLGKPHRGGSKKFYVYVRDPKTKRIKKVSFGMAGGGLRAKLNNPKARRLFSIRHNCPKAKDRTKASYWSCRLPRYSKLLGLKTTFSGYW
jgi:hypothetical protein